MKIWMSYNNKNGKSKFSLFGSLLCLGLVNFILILSITIFFYKSTFILSLGVFLIAIIDIVFAVSIGLSRRRDSLIFLRDDKMALFVVDISKFVRCRRGLLGLYSMETDKERIINSIIVEKKFEYYLMQESSLHGLETEIEYIESMKEREDGVNIVCSVIYPNRTKGRVSYFVKNGYEEQVSLIWDLERRVLSSYDGRVVKKSRKGQLILSSSLLLLDILLCVMSHPVLGIIDVSFYFYFLGAVLPIFCYFLYIVITIRRGL